MKLQRMGVVVVDKRLQTTITVAPSKGLLTHEEAQKILAGTIEKTRAVVVKHVTADDNNYASE